MKIAYVVLLFVGACLTLAAPAFADMPVDPSADLLSGTVVCPSPNNPLNDGLKQIGGNQFANVTSTHSADGSILVSADGVLNPQLTNKAITANSRPVGHIRLLMSYPAESATPNLLLNCQLTVDAFRSAE